MERWGDRCEQKYGQRICYAADEFYLKAQLPIPPAPFYGDFDQLENGVGLMASLKQEFLDALEDFVPPASSRKVTLATGVAAHPFLDTLLDELRQRCHNLTCNVVPIVNDFFGDTITVAGLVTGGDLLKQLRGRELGDALLLPDVMLRREGDIFLDDVSLEELSEALQIQIITCLLYTSSSRNTTSSPRLRSPKLPFLLCSSFCSGSLCPCDFGRAVPFF